MYRQTCEEKFPLLETAFAEENNANSVLYSHDIKGSSANIGAESMREVSAIMEKLSRDANYKAAASYLPALRTRYEKTCEVFDEYLGSFE
jgi:HPt (histidine-containing phosphotransfer) domain-containing protein